MPDPGAPAPPRIRYAGWWRRLGAVVIDGLLTIPFLTPGIVALVVGPSEVEPCTIDGELARCDVPTGGTIGVATLLYLLGLLVYAVIYSTRVGRTGQSWGMGAAGYRIVDARTGQPIGTGRSVGRYVARVLSVLPCYLGYLWPLWDAERRTFHDMLVGSRAVLA